MILYRENTIARLAEYLVTTHKPRRQPQFAHTGTAPDDGIAVIGVAGRYPGADDLHSFWENLAAGRDCVTEVPASRWDYRAFPYRDAGVETAYAWGSFLEGVDRFDAPLFQISPNEARVMDPQERLFLETAWHAPGGCRYSRESFLRRETNRVGVFAGVSYNGYQSLAAEEWGRGRPSSFSSQNTSVANRVSYHFNFNGPSITLDTACASSLAAVHMACESLRRGECESALAGGVNLSLHPGKYYYLQANHYLSPTGRCRAFSAEADGMVPGEGVGVVVLKPLKAAIAAGDPIYAVIRGSACNHGGKVSGYTVPNPRAQADLVRTALERAQVDPATITYVEAHGTGTPLGDPVELMGLTDAWRDRSNGYSSARSVQ